MRIERYAGGSSCKILLVPDCNQGVTMPHNHTNKYSCHWLTGDCAAEINKKLYSYSKPSSKWFSVIIFCRFCAFSSFKATNHYCFHVPHSTFPVKTVAGVTILKKQNRLCSVVCWRLTWLIHSLLNTPPLLVLTTTLQPPSESSPPTEECVLYPQLNEIC